MAIPLATQTMFADLVQRCLDAEFDDHFDERGLFKKRKRGGRFYWYFKEPGRTGAERYVGPVIDESITDRVERFNKLGSDFRDRQTLVRALIAAGLPTSTPLTGQVVEAMWKHGFFRLRGVLVGTVAFQAYAGILGLNLRKLLVQTQDADFAQFWGVSENIGESMPPVIEVLHSIDETFAIVPTLESPFVSSRYKNAAGYYVDILTPNRGSDEHQNKLARMKALSSSAAQPLRHLDYLIYEIERSVLLYGGGIPVTVPRAERFAVHKLIVATQRKNQAKSSKDIMQAQILILALASQRPFELAEAFVEACGTGRKWRDRLASGMARLDGEANEVFRAAVERWSKTRQGKNAKAGDYLGLFT